MTALRWLWRALLFFIPHWSDEDVALSRTADGWELECSMADVEPGERFDGVVRVSSLQWLWFGLLATYDENEIRPWSAA